MKIGIVDPFPRKTSTGIQTYTRKVIKYLSRLTPLVVYTSVDEDFRQLGVEIRKIHPSKIDTHLKRFSWEQFSLPWLTKEDKINLLFMPLPEVPIFVDIPVVAVVHDLIPLMMSKYHSPEYKLFFFSTLQTLKRAKGVITDSHHTLNNLKELKIFTGIKRIKVIYPGVEVAKSFPRILKYEEYIPYILYVGGFAPYKNIKTLLLAYSKLREELPHRLLLVGWGTPKQIQDISSFISSQHLKERVFIFQELPEKELHWLYSNCACFVFPSLYEGFGLPVLEALASRAVVICSNLPSLVEIGGDAVIYFNPNSLDELTTSLLRAIFDKKLREELKEKSSFRAKLFTWEKTAAEIFDFIQETLTSP